MSFEHPNDFFLPSKEMKKSPEPKTEEAPKPREKGAESNRLTKMFVLAAGLHAGAYSGAAYKPEIVREMTHVVEQGKTYAHVAEHAMHRAEAIPRRMMLAHDAKEQLEQNRFHAGTFILDAEMLDQRADDRPVNEQIPRAEYNRLITGLKQRLHGADPSDATALLNALQETVREGGYDYQGLGGTLMSDLLRDHAGSCNQISLLIDALSYDAGYRHLGLRIYPPDESGMGHIAPVMETTIHGQRMVIDLQTGRQASPTNVTVPFESVVEGYTAPHLRYLDITGTRSEMANQPFSVQPFHYPAGSGLSFPGSVPFFSPGITQFQSANMGAPAAQGTPRSSTENQQAAPRSTREQRAAEARAFTAIGSIQSAIYKQNSALFPIEPIHTPPSTDHLLYFETEPLPTSEQIPEPVIDSTPSYQHVERATMANYSQDLLAIERDRSSLDAMDQIVADIAIAHVWREMRDGAHEQHRIAGERFAQAKLDEAEARLRPHLREALLGSSRMRPARQAQIASMVLEDPEMLPEIRSLAARIPLDTLDPLWFRVPGLRDVMVTRFERATPADQFYAFVTRFSEEDLSAIGPNERIGRFADVALGFNDRIHRHAEILVARGVTEEDLASNAWVWGVNVRPADIAELLEAGMTRHQANEFFFSHLELEIRDMIEEQNSNNAS